MLSNLLGGESLSFQPDDVRPVSLRVALADRLGIRQHVFGDDGVTADISMRADAAKLMHAGKGSDRCMIFDRDMPGQRRRIGHDDVTAEQAIVRRYARTPSEIVIADLVYARRRLSCRDEC